MSRYLFCQYWLTQFECTLYIYTFVVSISVLVTLMLWVCYADNIIVRNGDIASGEYYV